MKYPMCFVASYLWGKLAQLWVGPPDDWNARVWIAVLFITRVGGWHWSAMWDFVARRVAR